MAVEAKSVRMGVLIEEKSLRQKATTPTDEAGLLPFVQFAQFALEPPLRLRDFHRVRLAAVLALKFAATDRAIPNHELHGLATGRTGWGCRFDFGHDTHPVWIKRERNTLSHR